LKQNLVVLLLVAAGASAEVRQMTLREVVARALERNPEVTLARLAERLAAERVEIARDAFIPKVYAGSGLAYTNGFPMSIEGSAPTVVQARAVAAVINRKLRHELAETREAVRGAAIDTEAKRSEVALRAAELYLEAERLGQSARLVQAQIDGLERVAAAVRARAGEGRELPVEVKRAELEVARARQRAQALEAEREYTESLLGFLLGLPAEDRVRPAGEPRPAVLPESVEEAVAAALESSAEIRRLESALAAQGYRVRAERAAKLPSLSLVAQYGVFARFNNYDEFFRKFQRHNGQLGLAFEIPLFTGSAVAARAAAAELEVERLRTELETARRRIAVDTRRQFERVKTAEAAAEVARQDLELARENLSVVLARQQEGRAWLRDVEAARHLEQEKWLAFYDAQYALEAARFRLLSQTGALLAQLR
jgi:outer membrane protein TolC